MDDRHHLCHNARTSKQISAMKKAIPLLALIAVIATAFTADTSTTPEDAKKVVETFMRQIEFAVNKNYFANGEVDSKLLAENLQSASANVKRLLEPGLSEHESMADDINGRCSTNFDRYFSTVLANSIIGRRLASYKLLNVKYTGDARAVDLAKSGEPVSYCIETSQMINNSKTMHFRFYVNIGSNKIGFVSLTSCSNNLPIAHTSSQANTNAAINYTNGNTNQAFNDYSLAVQLNPKDGEAYYRMAVMYYRGIGCSKSYKKAREYADKAIKYGNANIIRKAKNFKEYIEG